LAGCLGAAAGAVFAFVGKLAPAGRVGAVTGVVGAAGGIGGFLPPLIMGGGYALDGSYAIGLMLLSDVALAAAVFTWLQLGRARTRPGVQVGRPGPTWAPEIRRGRTGRGSSP
jgi:NNP family nitrate/nitrite transporter-like MFS transporter